jgi:transposase
MNVAKISILDRVKAKIQAVFSRHHPSALRAESQESGETGGAGAAEVAEAAAAVPETSSLWLTDIQSEIMEQMVRGATTEQRLVERARILLSFTTWRSKKGVAKELGLDINTVRKWCQRWEEVRGLMTPLETAFVPRQAYRRVIEEALKDAPRSGAPMTFTAEQITQIVAMACEVQDDSDAAVSHWTQGHLVEEAVKRGILDTISRSSVGRFLREADLKPHLTQPWLNAPTRKSPQFAQEVQEVCDVYHQTPELHEQGVHIMSTDEKPGIQALERQHPTQQARPGGIQPKERREYNYERHDTLCLIANFEVATGTIVAPTLGPTRTEADFVQHIAQTVALYPEDPWMFVVDQLNTHQSESLVKFVAEQCGIADDLGKKGQRGILATMSTRKAFLSDPSHRIRFVYTPKHTSWLNQIEMWFSILVRRLLKRGSFRSLGHLRERILKFIDFFNATMAKAFKWTSTGRPLTA